MQNVIHQFTKLAGDPRCNFFGGVTAGRDVNVDELRSRYNAVVLAYGAESDRHLNVPGEVRCTVALTAGMTAAQPIKVTLHDLLRAGSSWCAVRP